MALGARLREVVARRAQPLTHTNRCQSLLRLFWLRGGAQIPKHKAHRSQPLALTCIAPRARLTPQIKDTIAKFTETLATKQKEADEFGAKHRITAQGQQARAPAPTEDAGGPGVLI